MKIHPIHKLNGGIGATLCNNCGKTICLGHTEELYCDYCSIEIMFKVWSEEDEEEDDYDEYSDDK